MSKLPKTVSRRTFYLVVSVLLIAVIASSSFTLAVEYPHRNYSLNVDIQPGIMDMSQGQTNTLTAYSLNGTAPYSYVWYAVASNNVSDTDHQVFSNSNPAMYLLNETVAYINFKVVVTDANGVVGSTTETITDQAALAALTLSAGPYPGAPTYTIFTDASGNYYAKNNAGAISFTSTNSATVVQNAINAAKI